MYSNAFLMQLNTKKAEEAWRWQQEWKNNGSVSVMKYKQYIIIRSWPCAVN